MTKQVASLCMLGAMFCASGARAEVRLSPLFSDNMVLQQKQVVPVFGTADNGESVTVSIGGQSQRAIAGANGQWIVKFAPLATATSLEMTVSGKNQIVLYNVAVGEVWLASGQSNMERTLERIGAKKEVASANDPLLRVFTVGLNTADSPLDALGVKGQWQSATPQTAGKFSAVAYFFARELRRKLNVPVGIIHASWGGTPAEAWTSRSALETSPPLTPIVEEWERWKAAYPESVKKYNEETLPKWQLEADAAKAAGKPEPRKPTRPIWNNPKRASVLFNGMIAPLIPYAMQGVIWYQGEANAPRGEQYRTLFPTLIRDWRARWGQGDFPFLWVQLANYQKVQTEPSEGGWAFLREAQMQTLSLPNTGMASAIDLGDPRNPNELHPHNKLEVGRRLALWARALAYGEKLEVSGPLYQSIQVEKQQIRITFTHTQGGLTAKSGQRKAPLKGFAVAGVDQKWVWADSRIDGETVIVSSPQVAEPVAVRYGWAMNPIGNLVNGAGLPASPFRSDAYEK